MTKARRTEGPAIEALKKRMRAIIRSWPACHEGRWGAYVHRVDGMDSFFADPVAAELAARELRSCSSAIAALRAAE